MNKACQAVESLKVKAQTDAANAGPTDERLLERLLEVRHSLSEPQTTGPCPFGTVQLSDCIDNPIP